jgi:hypothetical protein
MRRQFKKWLSGERIAKPSFLSSLNYTWAELRDHIEKQFVRGMDWSNAGRWHIDHIAPKSSFDPSDAAQVRACWSLENLRPLWALDNMRKGARLKCTCTSTLGSFPGRPPTAAPRAPRIDDISRPIFSGHLGDGAA